MGARLGTAVFWRLLVAALALGLCGTSDAGSADARASDERRSRDRLVFDRSFPPFQTGPSRSHVYVMNADGTRLKALTSGNMEHRNAGAAPDGRWIAFHRCPSPGPRCTPYVIRPDGSGAKRILGGRFLQTRPWSPDSKSLLVRTQATLLVVSVDGKSVRRLPIRTDRLRETAWSPDGRYLAFARFAVGPKRASTIEVAELSTGRVRRIAAAPTRASLRSPVWLRDGKRVVFAKHPSSAAPDEIWVARARGRGEGRLVARVFGLLDRSSSLEVSPIADKILFTASDYGGAIEVVNADGTGRRELISVGHAPSFGPTWSPDGRRIAFLRPEPEGGDKTRVWVMSADGNGARELCRCGYAGSLKWLPGVKR